MEANIHVQDQIDIRDWLQKPRCKQVPLHGEVLNPSSFSIASQYSWDIIKLKLYGKFVFCSYTQQMKTASDTQQKYNASTNSSQTEPSEYAHVSRTRPCHIQPAPPSTWTYPLTYDPEQTRYSYTLTFAAERLVKASQRASTTQSISSNFWFGGWDAGLALYSHR